jgi:acyl carrier protein
MLNTPSHEREAIVTLDVAIATINEVLGNRRDEWIPVGADTTIEELGLDSLDLTELLVALEERVGCELDPASAEDIEAVRDLTELRPL